MLMDAGMDTGPVLAQARQPIRPTTRRCRCRPGWPNRAHTRPQTLPKWLAGELAPVAQDELPGDVSICRLIRKEDGRIDWRLLGWSASSA